MYVCDVVAFVCICYCFCFIWFFFFFKQKTAYEMRISDWSSDVCSSDLISADLRAIITGPHVVAMNVPCGLMPCANPLEQNAPFSQICWRKANFCRRWKIGRASCRERVCQYV